jgi:hypothetical protein
MAAFADQTGITDPILNYIYRLADLNGDNRLSWNELQTFQNWVYQNFRYQANTTALAPDDFGVAGGGDCEDFSLYTCGLLSFWGYESYVGVFAPQANPNSFSNHAVALLVVDKPAQFQSPIKLTADHRFPATAHAKTVIPIDYQVLDGFTNATPNPWVLIAVYEPHKIYGATM